MQSASPCQGSQQSFAMQEQVGGEIDDTLAITRLAYGYRALMVDGRCNVRLAGLDQSQILATTLTPDEWHAMVQAVDTPAFGTWYGQDFGMVNCSDGSYTYYHTPRGMISCYCGCDAARIPDALKSATNGFSTWYEKLSARATPLQGDIGVSVVGENSPQWLDYQDRFEATDFMPTQVAVDFATLALLDVKRLHRIVHVETATQLRTLSHDFEIWREEHTMPRIPAGLMLIVDGDGKRFAVTIGELAEPDFDKWR